MILWVTLYFISRYLSGLICDCMVIHVLYSYFKSNIFNKEIIWITLVLN
nr:MAG TPA: hypothetical protein [Caudoviricetes sp.]